MKYREFVGRADHQPRKRGWGTAGACAALLVPLIGLYACSGSKNAGFGGDGGGAADAGGGTDGFTFNPGDGGPSLGDGQAHPDVLSDGEVTVTTVVYANTDDTLFSMDPSSQMIAPVGLFAGMASMETITDCAVNAEGDVYVNSESAVYKAALPAMPSATASVMLTKVAAIALQSGQKFFALGFTPPGVLGGGMTEALIGGDGNGELWAIDTSSGALKDLGSFGPDSSGGCPNGAPCVFALSGDVVFYLDTSNNPTGLATIRSCSSGSACSNGGTCYCGKDFLVGIDMTALASAYSSGTPAASLLKGIYGGSSSGPGNGTGFYDLYGLAAWQGSVYGYARDTSNNRTNKNTPSTPLFLTIDTGSGAGSMKSSNFSFSNGWSGAGVSTKTVINVPPPPPPPK